MLRPGGEGMGCNPVTADALTHHITHHPPQAHSGDSTIILAVRDGPVRTNPG